MITVISNRKQILYSDLVSHLKKCAHPHVKRIILREKDLPLQTIVKKIEQIKSDEALKAIPLFLNGPYDLMETYGADGRHYTMQQFRDLNEKPPFPHGVSIHSLEEIRWINDYDVDYVLYGHVFPTACKAGLGARGYDNLKILIEASVHPLVALGGIDADNYDILYQHGCHEFAMMSAPMKQLSPHDFFGHFKRNLL
ncbi:MAG: thiamine phosphate synthase [Clostridia bacterium]|nr:thiamine phosphate synthase [Clostridia bacterium]